MGRAGRWLQLSAMVACGLAGAGALRAQTISEQYLLAAANQDRAAHGLGPVEIDQHLVQAARAHAYLMAQHRGISHQFEGEPDLAKRGGDAGAHFSLITENVAEAPNSALIHDLWMQSEGHRANLLDARVDAVGIAVIQRNGQLYAVEDFARTVSKLSLEQQELAVGNLLEAAGLRLGGSRSDARQTCGLSTGYVGGRQPWFVMRYTASSLDRLPDELTTRMATGKYHEASVGACAAGKATPFTSYNIAVLLYP